MCLSLCHVRKMLYFNHEEDLCFTCAHNWPATADPCVDCLHYQSEGAVCLLTSMKIPWRGWCCHFDAVPIEGRLTVTQDVVEPALLRDHGSLADIFWSFGIEAVLAQDNVGQSVAVADLVVPWVYGVRCDDWVEVLDLQPGTGYHARHPIPQAACATIR